MNFLTGKYGLNVLFAEGKADLEAGLSGIGSRYSVAETSIKPYPSCRSTHPGLDLTFDMMAEDSELPERVRSVEVESSQIVFDLCGRPFEPGNDPRVAAQFSIPYTLSVALTRGRIALNDFDPNQVVSDRGILEKTRTIRVNPRKEPVAGETWWWPHRVRMTLDDGSVREKEVTALRGSRARPFLREEQDAKLQEAGRDALSPDELCNLAGNARKVDSLGIRPVVRRMRAARFAH